MQCHWTVIGIRSQHSDSAAMQLALCKSLKGKHSSNRELELALQIADLRAQCINTSHRQFSDNLGVKFAGDGQLRQPSGTLTQGAVMLGGLFPS